MGLDCTAYKNIRQLEESEIDYEEYKDKDGKVLERYPRNGYIFYINPGFPHAAKDIRADVVYGYEEDFRWRAGSYSGYGEWRNWLATIAGYKGSEDVWDNAKEGDVFFELINFSDCEGTLGTLVCRKLLNDFIKFQPVVDKISDDYNYYKQRYADWTYALTLAADNGAISFH